MAAGLISLVFLLCVVRKANTHDAKEIDFLATRTSITLSFLFCSAWLLLLLVGWPFVHIILSSKNKKPPWHGLCRITEVPVVSVCGMYEGFGFAERLSFGQRFLRVLYGMYHAILGPSTMLYHFTK